jgi:hypothetical protein
MQVTILGARLSPFVAKVIRGVQRMGLTWERIETKRPAGSGEAESPDRRAARRGFRGGAALRIDARLAVAALALFAVSAARADEAFFRRCEMLRRAALVGADAPALGRLMLDGAQYIHSNGEVDDRGSLTRRIASGERRYRSIVADEERYACHASGCEVSGEQTLGVSARGRDLTLRSSFRATWLRAGDACQLVAYQSSPLATPAR